MSGKKRDRCNDEKEKREREVGNGGDDKEEAWRVMGLKPTGGVLTGVDTHRKLRVRDRSRENSQKGCCAVSADISAVSGEGYFYIKMYACNSAVKGLSSYIYIPHSSVSLTVHDTGFCTGVRFCPPS